MFFNSTTVCSSVLFWLVAGYAIFVSLQWAKLLQSASSDSFIKNDNFEIIQSDPITFKLQDGSISGTYDEETGAIQLLGLPYGELILNFTVANTLHSKATDRRASISSSGSIQPLGR